ncbi:tyrosine-type recombinase/integrase [Streptosporangium sp. NPDC049046]|uniref:tyrosine-type recombinase/integrase n=1 Tax=unclassified Streptosporangium TaxID=2632669 RepID=UPI00342DB278
MAYCLPVRPPNSSRTWTVVDATYRTVAPVEEWIEAHRLHWSPNTVRSYATALAQWWTFLEQRGDVGGWDHVGVPAVSAFVSWLHEGRVYEAKLLSEGSEQPPSQSTLATRLTAVLSFYRWQHLVHDVMVAKRLLKGTPRRTPARGLLAHLAARRPAQPSSLVRIRRTRARERPPVLLPFQVQAILDGCAVYDGDAGEWRGNLRDRMLFALLAESGMRLGEALGMRISDFVMGRGGTPYIDVVPRVDNPNDARVKLLKARRVYVGADLERLFADYLTHLAFRAAGLGIEISAEEMLFVNLDRPPFLAPLRESTVRDKVRSLKKKGVGAPGWTPHWFRHTHATALLLAGTADWVVSRRLGHAHVQTTLDLYGWVSEDEALRAAANWETYTTKWQIPDEQ